MCNVWKNMYVKSNLCVNLPKFVQFIYNLEKNYTDYGTYTIKPILLLWKFFLLTRLLIVFHVACKSKVEHNLN